MKKKRRKKYQAVRDQVRDHLAVQFLEIHSGFIPGSRCVIATVADMAFPVGTVWYTLVDSSTCFIETSYVEPWARRLGVRTRLNRALIEGYPNLDRIVTGEALGRASRKWMKREGYEKRDGRWVLDLSEQEESR